MLNRTALLLLACTLHSGWAFADEVRPKDDPRIQRLYYNENSVYRLDLYLKSVTALQFSSNEEVESILIGDSASWEVVKLKAGNVVSLKPTIPSATTNMTIYTDQRVYTFELRSLGEFTGSTQVIPLFRSVFVYPQKRKRKPTGLQALARINTNYLVSGKAEFRPIWVQDDGRQTSFFLPENAPRPAIFKVGSDRKEQLINSRTQGNRVVVDGTSENWVLRIGNQSVCIKRAEPDLKAASVTNYKRANHVG